MTLLEKVLLVIYLIIAGICFAILSISDIPELRKKESWEIAGKGWEILNTNFWMSVFWPLFLFFRIVTIFTKD